MGRKPHRKVIALLKERDIKLKEVAAAAEVGVSAVSGVLNDHWQSRPIQVALAQVLKLEQQKFDRIWNQ